jgi:hypothetical protein
MSRSSIIVSYFLAVDNSKPTALGWKPWHLYFTVVKYNMSAGLAQATGKYPGVGYDSEYRVPNSPWAGGELRVPKFNIIYSEVYAVTPYPD